jgi:hypothetical protein
MTSTDGAASHLRSASDRFLDLRSLALGALALLDREDDDALSAARSILGQMADAASIAASEADCAIVPRSAATV